MYKYREKQPSKTRLKRMSLRQLRDAGVGQYRTVALSINFELMADIGQEDLSHSPFQYQSDYQMAAEDFLTDWLVDLVEKHGLYCCFGTSPVREGSFEYQVFIDPDQKGDKAIVPLFGFVDALVKEPKVNWVDVTVVDAWKCSLEEDDYLDKLKRFDKEHPVDCESIRDHSKSWFK